MKFNEINGFTKREIYELMFSRPSFAQLELTRNCNQDCAFCFSRCSSSVRFLELKPEQWIYIINNLSEIGVATIHLTGGEVLLYQGIIEILEEIKVLGLKSHINTNGLIDTTNIIPLTDEIVFSVHGLRDIHNGIVGNSNSFNSVIDNIERCNKAGIDVYLNTVMTKSNFGEIENIFNFFQSHYDIKKYSFTLGAKSNNGLEFAHEFIVPTEENLKQYFNALKKIGRDKLVLKHSMHTLFEFSPDDVNSIELPICAAGKDKLVVKYDGSVYPCSFFQNDDYYCGNLLQEEADAIWDLGKGFLKFRELIYDEKICIECQGCKKLTKCFGGCRIWTKAYIEKGEIYYDRDYRCEILHSSC